MDNVNSIEQQFVDLVALLRKPVARSVGTLWAAFGALPESFEPDECANYFRHAGKGSTWTQSALFVEA